MVILISPTTLKWNEVNSVDDALDQIRAKMTCHLTIDFNGVSLTTRDQQGT